MTSVHHAGSMYGRFRRTCSSKYRVVFTSNAEVCVGGVLHQFVPDRGSGREPPSSNCQNATSESGVTGATSPRAISSREWKRTLATSSACSTNGPSWRQTNARPKQRVCASA